jgi:hypothetical protein
MTHYHVIAGFHGCIPEMNSVFEDKENGLSYLKDCVEDLRDSENVLEKYSDEYFEVTEKTSALCDYLELSECTEIDCLTEEDF